MDGSAIPREDDRRELWLSSGSPVAEAELHFGGGNDRFVLDGVDLGIDYHLDVQSVRRRLEDVMAAGKVERSASPWFCLGESPEVICAEVESCVPLCDPQGIIASWKHMVSPYPQRFRTNLLHACLFEARYRLKDVSRGSDLGDIPLVHASLSELSLCLFRMLFALNRKWFRGMKYAMASAGDLRLVPDHWLRDVERALCRDLSRQRLSEVHAEAGRLTVELARLAAKQGEQEDRAVRTAASAWPDIDPMIV